MGVDDALRAAGRARRVAHDRGTALVERRQHMASAVATSDSYSIAPAGREPPCETTITRSKCQSSDPRTESSESPTTITLSSGVGGHVAQVVCAQARIQGVAPPTSAGPGSRAPGARSGSTAGWPHDRPARRRGRSARSPAAGRGWRSRRRSRWIVPSVGRETTGAPGFSRSARSTRTVARVEHRPSSDRPAWFLSFLCASPEETRDASSSFERVAGPSAAAPDRALLHPVRAEVR